MNGININGININEIGVVALSRSEEYDIAGGWDWNDFASAALTGGISAGIGGAVIGFIAPVPGGMAMGFFTGAAVYSLSQLGDLWDTLNYCN